MSVSFREKLIFLPRKTDECRRGNKKKNNEEEKRTELIHSQGATLEGGASDRAGREFKDAPNKSVSFREKLICYPTKTVDGDDMGARGIFRKGFRKVSEEISKSPVKNFRKDEKGLAKSRKESRESSERIWESLGKNLGKSGKEFRKVSEEIAKSLAKNFRKDEENLAKSRKDSESRGGSERIWEGLGKNLGKSPGKSRKDSRSVPERISEVLGKSLGNSRREPRWILERFKKTKKSQTDTRSASERASAGSGLTEFRKAILRKKFAGFSEMISQSVLENFESKKEMDSIFS
jgi:hypothetical protein